MVRPAGTIANSGQYANICRISVTWEKSHPARFTDCRLAHLLKAMYAFSKEGVAQLERSTDAREEQPRSMHDISVVADTSKSDKSAETRFAMPSKAYPRLAPALISPSILTEAISLRCAYQGAPA